MVEEIVIELTIGFAGLIIALVGMLWYVCDRISDKIRESEEGLSGKFDVLIDRLLLIVSDISLIKELTKAHQTIEILLPMSKINCMLSPRIEEFTIDSATYLLSTDVPILTNTIKYAVEKLDNSNFILLRTMGTIIVFKIKTRNIDENTTIIKSFIDILDNEITKDGAKEWADAVESKLKKIL